MSPHRIVSNDRKRDFVENYDARKHPYSQYEIYLHPDKISTAKHDFL